MIDRKCVWTATVRRIALLLAVACTSGCAVGPDFEKPRAPAQEGYTREPLGEATAKTDIPGGEAQKFVRGLDISHQWWTLFQSRALNTLLERAVRASPSLAAAEAALRQARELVYAQEGFFYPTVGASFAPGYQKASAQLSPPLNNNNLRYSLYMTQATVSYAPDVFGGNRRAVESLEAQAESQKFQLDAAYVTLTSNLVTAAIQEASIRAQIAAAKEIIALARKSLDLLQVQLRAGAVTGLDVAAQESALAGFEQALPPLEKQLQQNRDLLLALAGGVSSDGAPETFELTDLHLPTELPVSLPSKLVEQRPDVRAAEALLHAASAQIGVAVAKRLPQFTLSGGYGGVANHFAHMFDAGNTFWSVVGSAAQTVFDGGTLYHQQKAAEAAFDQAGAQYRSIVISAFQNVADSLYALKSDADTLRLAVAAERAAKVTLEITTRQQQAGAVNYLSLLSAQLALEQSVITRVQSQAARFSDTAALFQALGGGWWNRPEERGLEK